MNEETALEPIVFEDVIGDCFARYSKYIIQDRAIPDVRDGLKPVQRRILYAMYEAGNTPEKAYRKSAKTVGDVMGNFHPHGESSIYEGMVRLAQPWKMNHPLIDGHGNWGSLDDDPAAAMRYTEARLSPLALVMLQDIDRATVAMRDNFDNTLKEPTVLPAHFPNLLVNGASGISAGFATEIPTHNLGEVIDASIVLLDDPDASLEQLMRCVKGPDFPTGGLLIGTEGIQEAYTTGKGRLLVRAKTMIEELRGGRQQIVITQIPYGVIKAKLVMSIEHLRVDKRIDGIAEVRDESGRAGLRIVIELKKDADAEAIVHYLFKKTDLQLTLTVNMVAIVNKAPQLVGLKAILQAFLAHEKEIVLRRTQYDYDRAAEREHVLAGFALIWAQLDAVIALVRAAETRAQASERLVAVFHLSAQQADAILSMPLYRLTRLEIAGIEQQLAEIRAQMAGYMRILKEERVLVQTIKTALREVKKRFSTPRQTEMIREVATVDVVAETLVPSEDVWVAFSALGMMKRTSGMSFVRSGGDVRTAGCVQGDAVLFVHPLNTRQFLLLFSQTAMYATVAVHAVPEARWKEPGVPMTNCVSFAPIDRLIGVIPVALLRQERQGYIICMTRKGWIKATEIGEYGSQRQTPITAMRLQSEDELVYVYQSEACQEIVWWVTKHGWIGGIEATTVPLKARSTPGVRAMRLDANDEVIAVFPDHIVWTDIVLVTREGALLRTSRDQQTKMALGQRIPSLGQRAIGAEGGHHWYCAVAVTSTMELRIVPDQGEAVVVHVEHIPLWATSVAPLLCLPEGMTVKWVTKHEL